MDSIVLTVAAFFLKLVLIESKLSKAPAAVQVVRIGSRVILECFTENKGYAPSWTHQPVGSSNPEDVYLLSPGPNNEPFGRMTQTYYNRRFKIKEDRGTGEYSLEIQSVKLEDAGEYRCQARGGLGQSGSAQLIVIESPPECASNVTGEALGSNSCGLEPDIIALTCTFAVRGNSLPHVMWVKTGNPDSEGKVRPAQWTDEPGLARSEFVVEACREKLTESSFTCIVQMSDSVKDETRLSCDIPKITVIESANATEDRTVSRLEEVHCDLSLFQNSTGCRWERREGSSAVVVSRNQQLNLFQPEMTSGLYVCIVDCNIHGDMCPFEALRINYINPSEETGASWVTVVIVVIVVVAIVVAVLAVGARRLRSKRPAPYTAEPVYANRLTETQRGNGNVAIGVKDLAGKPLRNGNVGIDVGDWVGQPRSRAARLKALEDKAKLKMRANAEKTQENPGIPMPDEGGDVAEGIPNSTEKKNE